MLRQPCHRHRLINSFADVYLKEINGLFYPFIIYLFIYLVCVAGAPRGNLLLSLLAFRALLLLLLLPMVDVKNCAFYLIRLLASLSRGNVRAVPEEKGCATQETFIIYCRRVAGCFYVPFTPCVPPHENY